MVLKVLPGGAVCLTALIPSSIEWPPCRDFLEKPSFASDISKAPVHEGAGMSAPT